MLFYLACGSQRILPVHLHICTSESWGGLELYAATLMIELKKSGYDVAAVCTADSPIERRLRAHHIECHHLPSSLKVSLGSVRHLRYLLGHLNVDVVHVHFHKDIWLASILLRRDMRVRLFMSVYMGVGKKTDPLHRWIYRRVDALFTSSPEMKRRLPSLYPVAPERIHLLPYGRPLEMYRRDEDGRRRIRELLNVAHDDVLVGTMVRIDPGKGVIDFARSFPYLSVKRSVKYLIVGEPTRLARSKAGSSPYEPHCAAYLDELKAYVTAQHLEERVLFAGYQEDAVAYLNAMDVFVFPSRDELYSLVVLDAMGMGLPVVAAAAGGNLVQIDDRRRGLLYPVGDSRQMAARISQFVEHPELRASHGSAGRTFVEQHHDMKQTIAALAEFFPQEPVEY